MQVQWHKKEDFILPEVGECWCYDWGEEVYMRIEPNYMVSEDGILSVELHTGRLVETEPSQYPEITRVKCEVNVLR